MNNNFNGLRLIGKISKFLGVVGILLGVVSLFVAPLALSTANVLPTQVGDYQSAPATNLAISLLVGVIMFFIGCAAGMLLFAVGECFNLLISIEANTRKAADLLEKHN